MSVDVKYALERVLGLCGLKELKEKQKEVLLAFIMGTTSLYPFEPLMGSLSYIGCSD